MRLAQAMKALKEMVRSISDDELAYIAALDYGQDTERQRAALRRLIFEQDCILEPGQHYFPYEVIELGRIGLQANHERESGICAMLVLLNIQAGADLCNTAQYEFEAGAGWYDALPKEMSQAIFAAHLALDGPQHA